MSYDETGRYQKPYDTYEPSLLEKILSPWQNLFPGKQKKNEQRKNEQKYGELWDQMDQYEDQMTRLFEELAQIPGFEGSLIKDFDRTNPLNIFAAMQPSLLDKFMGVDQGGPEDANLQNYRTSPSIIPIYQDGGEVELTPIQTEKGEIAVLEDTTISEVKSDDVHDNMDDEDITDILPVGSWIFSDNVKVKKEDADVIFGYSQPLYEETSNKTKVEEINFNQLFKENEDELSAAELALRIKKKFPINDVEEGNLLTNAANTENRISRQPYLEVLKMITELHTDDNLMGVAQFKKGGKVKSKKAKYSRKVQSFDGSGGVDSDDNDFLKFLNPARLVFDIFRYFNDTKRQNDLQERNEADVEALAYARQQNLDHGTLATLASIVGQDPRVQSPDSSAAISTYRQQFDRTPQYLRDQAASRIDRTFNQAANQVFENAPNFQTASANLAGLYSRAQAQQADLAANQNMQDIGLRNNFLRGLSQLRYQDAANQAQAQNQTVTNQNQLLSNVGATATNYYNQRTANQASDLQARLAIQGQAEAARAAVNNAFSQNLTNLAALSYRQPQQTTTNTTNTGYNPNLTAFEQTPIQNVPLSYPGAPDPNSQIQIGNNLADPRYDPLYYTRGPG